MVATGPCIVNRLDSSTANRFGVRSTGASNSIVGKLAITSGTTDNRTDIFINPTASTEPGAATAT